MGEKRRRCHTPDMVRGREKKNEPPSEEQETDTTSTSQETGGSQQMKKKEPRLTYDQDGIFIAQENAPQMSEWWAGLGPEAE